MGLTFYTVFVSWFLWKYTEHVAGQEFFELITPYNNRLKVPVPGQERQLIETNKKVLSELHNLRQRHKQDQKTPMSPEFNRIPERFEATGINTRNDLAKYVAELENIADRKNMTLRYKVQVIKSPKQTNIVKMSKVKTKKYNVPLKKESMRLSGFEILMRKLAKSNVKKYLLDGGDPNLKTTDAAADAWSDIPFTSSKAPVLKFKPIISKVKTKFAKKYSKPVKKTEVILKS